MAHIEFVDQTLRDGQQSYTGLRLRAQQSVPALPDMDRTGYRVMDITGSSIFAVLVRHYRDDPWATLDHLVTGLPSNVRRAGTRTNSTVGFALTPHSVLDLFTRTLVKHGIDSFWIYDCLYGMEDMKRMAGVVADLGAEVVPSVMYGISDVHTDEWFATRVKEMVSWDTVDAIYLEDAPGVLTPERAHTLIPALQAAAGDIPIELHSHTTVGMAQHVYIEGLRHGITILHTSSLPFANGPSIPSIEAMLEIITDLGHTHSIDESLLKPVADHFFRVGAEAGWKLGIPNEYRLRHYRHQLPGGMTGTLKNQLAEHGMSERLDEVLEEIVVVHGELGKPVMATPFSQLMGIQAVLNIVTGDRYSIVPNEVVQYAYGHYGQPPAPIQPDVLDKIMATPQAKEFATWERPQPTLEEIRRKYGIRLSDEELLLRILLPGNEVDAMLAAGPLKLDQRSSASEVVSTVRELATEAKSSRYFSFSRGEMSMTLSRRAPERADR